MAEVTSKRRGRGEGVERGARGVLARVVSSLSTFIEREIVGLVQRPPANTPVSGRRRYHRRSGRHSRGQGVVGVWAGSHPVRLWSGDIYNLVRREWNRSGIS